jgi:hypothetical protein
MNEIIGNIWDYHSNGEFVCVTTNGNLNSRKECIMGAGIAKECKLKFPQIPAILGDLIKHYGNNVYMLSEYKIFSFPTKYNWIQHSNIKLILHSFEQLKTYIDKYNISRVYCPKPGCGNGKLNWNFVKKNLNTIYEERIIFISNS